VDRTIKEQQTKVRRMTMNMKIMLGLVMGLLAEVVQAQTSTWLGNSGNWSDTTTPGGVWTGGTPADGADNTANFTGINIIAAKVVTNDTARTIGNITFTDATTSHDLTITGSSALTLARNSGTPTIDVTQNGRTLTISCPVEGSNGLQKTGAGILIFSGTNNTYSGTTTLTAGTLEGLCTGTSLTPSPFGTSSILLNGGTLDLRAEGTGGNTTETITFGNNVTVGANATIYVNRIGGAASNKTMGLGTLTIGANTLYGTAANVGYSAGFTAVSLTGNATFSPGSSSTLVLGAITQSGGSYSLTKTGVGTLKLTGINDYAGGTILNGGTLSVNSNAALGESSTGITVIGNTTLSSFATASTEYNRAISLGAGTTLTLTHNGGNTASFSGAITGSGNLAATLGTSGSTIALSNTGNTFTGDVLINTPGNGNLKLSFNSIGDAGKLSLGKNSYTLQMQYTGSSDLVLNNRRIDINSSFGGIFDGGGTGPINMFENNGAGTIKFKADMTVAAGKTGIFFFGGTNAGANTYGGVIPNSSGGTLTIAKWGAGKWILTGDNTYAGNAVTAGGILSVGKIASVGAAQPLGLGYIQLGLTSYSGNLEFTGTIDTTTDKQVQIGGGQTNGSGTGGILNNGTGTLTFDNTTFNVAQTGTTVSRTLTLGGINIGTNTIAGTIQNNATGGLVGIAKTGSGTWTLQGANTYTSSTDVNAGTLRLQSGATTITQTLGGLRNQLADGTLMSNKSGDGNLSTTFSSYARAGGATGNIVSTGGINGTDNSVFITGTAGFIDKGLYLGGSEFAARNGANGYIRALAYGSDPNAAAVNTITGSNHVKLNTSPGSNQNSTTLLSLNLQGDGVNWTNNSGQTLTSPGIIKSGVGSSTISGGNVYGGNNIELVIRTDAASDLLTISSVLNQGSGVLTKSGAGTLTLSGNNTYTGQTHVNAGTLSISANNNLGAESTGATLNLKGGTLQATSTFGLFNGTAGTNNRAVTLLNQSTIEVTGANTLSIAGVISNNGSAGPIAPGFNKTGTGTLVLSGANTYTGETIINEGKLALGGHNVLNGKAITLNGGTLDAGTYTNTLSTLMVSGGASLVLNPGAVLAFADSSAVQWTGTLYINGAFSAGTSLRFGTSSASLSSEQIASLKATGYTLSLDADGYLRGKPSGTIISFQ
jgi:fibronectin-binding autotransporter adhesin